MAWTTILTVLALTLASIYLVSIEGWEVWEAYTVVAGVAIGACLTLLALLLLLATGGRAIIWHSFVVTLKRDLSELLDAFGIKKRSRKEKNDEN